MSHNTTEAVAQKKEVVIDYQVLKIMYEVEYATVQEIAKHFGIDWADAKKALRDSGITVRINEPQAEEPEKPYIVVLTDVKNLKAKATKANKPAKADTKKSDTPASQDNVTVAQA